LLKLCKQYNVPKLVVISSIAAVYGSVGQSNYSVANAEMNRLIGMEDKVQCLSVSLGPIGDVG
jgi:nucleoside-diphosphate-sugar epimerase